MKPIPNKTMVWGGIALIVGLALIWAVRSILLPFVAAFVLAYALHPVAEKLTRRCRSRSVATGFVVIGFCLIVAALFLLLIPIVQAQVIDFIQRIPNLSAEVWRFIKNILTHFKDGIDPKQMSEMADSVNGIVMNVLLAFGAGIEHILSGGAAVFQILALLLITPVVLFYVLRDWNDVREHIGGLMPKTYQKQLASLWEEINQTLSGFIRGQTLVCLSLAGYYAIGLMLTGLEYGVLVGLSMGILSFVPYVGFGCGLVLSIFLALMQGFSWGQWVGLACVLGLGQILEGYVLTPRLVGSRVGLHPVWIIFALLAGGALMGFLGILLAVPVAAVIGVLVRRLVRWYRESDFYRGNRPL